MTFFVAEGVYIIGFVLIKRSEMASGSAVDERNSAKNGLLRRRATVFFQEAAFMPCREIFQDVKCLISQPLIKRESLKRSSDQLIRRDILIGKA